MSEEWIRDQLTLLVLATELGDSEKVKEISDLIALKYSQLKVKKAGRGNDS